MAVSKRKSCGIGALLLLLCLLSLSVANAFVTPGPLIRPRSFAVARYSALPSHVLHASKHTDATHHQVSRWRKCRQGITSLWNKRCRPSSRRRGVIAAAALVFVSLFQPKRALAAMAGGMGGSKGPIAPMARYVVVDV